MPMQPPPPSNSGGDDITKIGALSDGFANTATNSTEIDDGSNGYIGTANGDNRGNSSDSGTHDSNNDNSQTNNSNNSTDSSTHTDVDAQVDVAIGNGNDRDNHYDWDYTSKTVTLNDNDTTSKIDDSYNTSTKNETEYKTEDSYNSKVEDSNNTSTKTETEYKTEDSYNTKVEDSNNSKIEDSYNSDSHFANLDNLSNTGNLGLAGGDLTFNLGDDFSFNLDVRDILNNSLNGDGNDVGFSLVQANHLADQDYASGITMENAGATNTLNAYGGDATGAAGIDAAGNCWSPAANVSVGEDMNGTSTANASAIVANSGFHMELVQGANMLSNTLDSTIAGGDVHHTGGDASA